jgi:MFS family permease
LTAALTMSVVSTLGTPLIPKIAAEQHVSLESAQWVLTITLVVGAVVGPVLGRLGDGRLCRHLLLLTLAVVCLGSAVAATASGFAQLIVGKGLQGVGYGVIPLAMALLREHLSGAHLHRGIAAVAVAGAAGTGLGYPLTGLVAEAGGVSAAFWFGAVFALASIVAVARVIPAPAPASEARRLRFDGPGAVLLGTALTSVLLGVSNANTWGWGSPRVLTLFGTGLLLAVVWVAVELRTSAPLVDLRLVAERSLLGANIAAVLLGVGMYIALSLVVRFVQTPQEAGYGFQASLFATGLFLMPFSVGTLLSQPIGRCITRRFGIGAVLPAGSAWMMATMLWAAFVHDDIWQVGFFMLCFGIGIGCTFAILPTLIVPNVPQERTGSATGLNYVLRSVGGAIGSTIAATILSAHHAVSEAAPDVRGYVVAYLVGGGLFAITAVIAVALRPRPTIEVDATTAALSTAQPH